MTAGAIARLAARAPSHPRPRLRPGRDHRQHDRDRHPADAGPRRRPARRLRPHSHRLDRRRPLHASRRRLPHRARDDAAGGGRLLRLRAARVRRNGRVRGRLDRLAHLLRRARLHLDRPRRVRRRARALAGDDGHADRAGRAPRASWRCSGRGVRVSSRFQEVATAIKFAAFLALVLGCLALVRARGAGAGGAASDAGLRRPDHRAAVGRDHLRRLAERALFHRGGSRSSAQPAARDDRRRRRRDRRLPAGQRRAAGGAAASPTWRTRRCRPPTPRRSCWAGAAAR